MLTPQDVIRFSEVSPQPNPPPKGCVDLDYDRESGTFIKRDALGVETPVGSGGGTGELTEESVAAAQTAGILGTAATADATAFADSADFRTSLRYQELAVHRDLYPVHLPVYSGDGRGTGTHTGVIHPDVIVLETPWNGYTHWMAITPYPGLSNVYENPSIYASNNGIDWVIPAGLTNPLAPKPSTGFNSDTCLIIVSNVLYCFWRQGLSGDPEKIYQQHSSDGFTWSAPVLAYTFAAGNNGGVSPSIIHDGTQFVMYYATRIPTPSLKKVTCATIDGTWSSPTTVTFTGTSAADKPIEAISRMIWHLQCFRYGGKTYMLAQVPQTGAADDTQNGLLYLGESTDGTSFRFNQTAIFKTTPTGPSKAVEGYYRSCIVPVVVGGDLLLRMWYSTESANLGYAEISCDGRGQSFQGDRKRSVMRKLVANSAPINNTSTLTTNAILTVPLEANVLYELELVVGVDFSNTTTGVRATLIPSVANIIEFTGAWGVAGDGLPASVFGRKDPTSINAGTDYVSSTAAVLNYEVTGKFLVRASAATTLQFAFAQNTANATNSVIRNQSWMILCEFR